MKNRAYIIEPHYDDAWLSMGNFIMQHPDIDFVIITLTTSKYNKDNRTAYLSKYSSNIKATFALRFPDILWENRIRPDPANLEEHNLAIEKYKKMSQYSKDSFRIIDDIVKNADMTFAPLGIQHPMHMVVGDAVNGKNCYRYVDNPYAHKTKFADLFEEMTKGSKVIWEHENNVKKTEIFTEVYKSQAFFFKKDCLIRPEIILQF